jgi:hypothetical protein
MSLRQQPPAILANENPGSDEEQQHNHDGDRNHRSEVWVFGMLERVWIGRDRIRHIPLDAMTAPHGVTAVSL